jgi:histidinol-phosphatase (PHP family)
MRYFETILYNVKHFKSYNVYGHLDYILRYGRTKAEHFRISDYRDLFKEIFKTIVYDGKGIEINTAGLYHGLDFPHPHTDILRLYKEAGGEIITIGSDAHKVNFVGYGFDKAKETLQNHGFKYYCTFKNMKPEFIAI